MSARFTQNPLLDHDDDVNHRKANKDLNYQYPPQQSPPRGPWCDGYGTESDGSGSGGRTGPAGSVPGYGPGFGCRINWEKYGFKFSERDSSAAYGDGFVQKAEKEKRGVMYGQDTKAKRFGTERDQMADSSKFQHEYDRVSTLRYGLRGGQKLLSESSASMYRVKTMRQHFAPSNGT